MSDAKHSSSNSVLLALIAVAAIALVGYGAAAMAQEQQQQQPQEQAQQQPAAQEEQPAEEFKEEVVVTGTLIPRPTLEAMSPVSTLEIEELTYRGVTRMEDLLTQLPQVFVSQNSVRSNDSTGVATVNLRNLGSARTLVLIDGVRMTPADTDQTSGSGDMNFIPTALVKRVDILTGGASATYGADAAAGVVNLVIDREFEGVRGGVQFTGFNHNNDNDLAQSINAARDFSYPTGNAWDGNLFAANVALGGKFAEGRGHGVLYLDYRDASALLKNARDYTNCSVSAGLQSADGGPRCSGSGTSDLGTFYVSRPDYSDYGEYKVDPSGAHAWVDREGYAFNYNPYNYLQRPDTRWVAGGFLNYDFSEAMEGYLEVMYMNDQTDAQIAPSGDFFDTLYVNVDNPMLSAQQRQILLDAGWGPHDDAYVNIGRRNVEGGARINSLSHNSWRFVGGLRGDIGRGWSYDVNGLIHEVSAPASYLNDVNKVNIQNALFVVGDPNDPSTWQCRDATARAQGCVPYNIFRTGGVTQEALDWIDIALLNEGGTSTKMAAAKLNGDLGEYGLKFPSAAEGIQLALGADYGVFGMYLRYDQAYQEGTASGQGAKRLPVDGSYDVKELYAEAFIPIVQGVSGAQELSLELGYRYSDYSTSGGWPTYKAQASWAPGAGLKFRGGLSRATRSPNVIELFTPQGIALGGNNDPCAGPTPDYTLEQCARTGVTAAQYGGISVNPAGQYYTMTGGNPLLDPEVADTISYGIVFTPSGSSFTAALDYYKIEIDDTIGNLLADDIINKCLLTGDPGLCSLIHRDRFGSLWRVQGEAYTETTQQNVGLLLSEGVDVNLNYVVPTGNSFFTINFIGSYLLQNNRDTGLFAYDCVGYFGDSCNDPYGATFGMTPDWRHLARVTWETGSIALSLGWRYIAEMQHQSFSDDEGISDPGNREYWTEIGSGSIAATNYFDLAFNWKLMDGLQLTLGVNNIMDEEPPLGAGMEVVDYGPGFYGFYDAYGRYLHSAIQFQF